MSYNAGNAFITVSPDMSKFQDDVKAKLTDTPDASVLVTADTSKLTTDLDEATKDRVTEVTADADTAKAGEALDSLAAGRTAAVEADADTKAATAALSLVADGRKTTILADVDDAAATIELDALTRDRTVKVKVNESGGGAAAAGQEAASGLPGLGAAGPVAIGGAVAVGAALLPAAVPALVGAGFAGLGVTAAAHFSKSLQTGLTGTENTFKSVLATAVGPLGNMFSSMLPGINQFITAMGPQLQQAFSASAPYLAEFLTVGESAVSTLLPAFTSLMTTFAPELPQIGVAFQTITNGLAGFLTALGPGMTASVTVFKAAADVIAFSLQAAGLLASGLALEFADAGHGISVAWNAVSSAAVAVTGAVTTAWNSTVSFFTSIPGKIEGIFSGAASWLVSAGKTVIGGLVSGVTTAYTAVTSFFTSIPGKVEGAFSGAASWLVAGGKSVISGFSTAVTGAWASVTSFFSSVAGKIEGAFSGAGSWLVSAGKNIVQGVISGIESIGSEIESTLLSFVPAPVRAAVSAVLDIPGFATGTPSAPAGWAWVGERGPELVHFAGGEQVKTNAASLSALSGAATAQSLSALSVPSIAGPGSLPGVNSPLRGAPLQLQVTYVTPAGDAIAGLVSGFQFHINGNYGGDVQAAMGYGPARV